MANLGFVGLGVMGSQMVKRLLEKGHGVTGYNRTRSKARWLIDAGMKWAGSPREVAHAADITFSMVTNSAALAAIADGADGIVAGLDKGKLLVHRHVTLMANDTIRSITSFRPAVKPKGCRRWAAPINGPCCAG